MSITRLELLLFGLVACHAPERAELGHLEVRWKGSREGSISGSATAGWCAIRQVLQIRTIQGDTGIALALYPGKTLRPGAYPVVDPVKAESVPPAAGVALRILTQNLVQGFQGDSGGVRLERSSTGQFSGTVNARARSVVDTQRIRLEGAFRELRVVTDTAGCSLTEPPDEDF